MLWGSCFDIKIIIDFHFAAKRTLPGDQMNDEQQKALMQAIDVKIGEVRTEAIDLTFGEIINLKAENEIRIDAEYQRLFRWSTEQKSRLVESILLRLPIPPVFFIENEDGRYELIDGLQRISSVIQFIQPDLLNVEKLSLAGCDIVEQLNGYSFDELPLTLKLQVKRSAVRALIIKRQSKNFLRYEMFKRLNTGGSLLSNQEIRNCSARLFGDAGVKFYNFLIELSQIPAFEFTTSTLADVDLEKRGREELALRFFAAKNGADLYQGHIGDWLDSYMEAILLGKLEFDFESEKVLFHKTFAEVERALGEFAFCKFINDKPTGGLAPAYFEAVAVAFANEIDKAIVKNPAIVMSNVVQARQTKEFRANVGAGANNRTKLKGRIAIIRDAISQA